MNITMKLVRARSIPFDLKALFPAITSSTARCSVGLLLVLGMVSAAHAQYIVDGQISSQSVGGGTYNYTINLNNNIFSSNPIGTFWFGWVPDYYGYDLLPSSPTTVQAPAGWGYAISYGSGYGYYPDGYSIEYYANGTPLAPGSSLTFGFTSTDAPSDVEGTSPFADMPASTSYVYSGYAFSDAGAQINLEAVPEPSSISLMMAGAVGLLFVGRRRLAKRQLKPAFQKASQG